MSNEKSVNSAPGKSSGTSSINEDPMGGGRSSNYQDEAKLFATIKLYSTLEDNNDGESDVNLGSLGNRGGGSGRSQSSFDGSKRKNILARFEHRLFQILFRLNHVMLMNQSVNVLFFHLILFLSFCQVLFNIFYMVDIQFEFKLDPSQQGPQPL